MAGWQLQTCQLSFGSWKNTSTNNQTVCDHLEENIRMSNGQCRFFLLVFFEMQEVQTNLISPYLGQHADMALALGAVSYALF